MPELDAPARLNQPGGSLEPAAARVAHHNARRLGGKVLVATEAGQFELLSAADYARYLAGAVSPEEALGQSLVRKDLMRDQLDFQNLAWRSVERHLLDRKGPGVHTLVVTQRCNFKCLYCHASVVDPSRVDKDMSVETARRAVDFIFQSQSPTLMIEFQGGEPLLNWPVVKFVVEYAKKKNGLHKRALHFGLISNFSLLDDAKVDWLAGQGVSFCTSLDGPEAVHNANRIYLGGNSHAQVLAHLRGLQQRRAAGLKLDAPNAICTVTRQSFGQERAIVDQLVSLGIERVQLGPLDPIGFALKSWDKIGYGSREFVDFYEKTLDYIIERSESGVRIYEKMALILLIRLLESDQWRFPDAAGLARLAYNHDGGIYTCEEGRLLANAGDEFFRIGRLGESSYGEVLDHPTIKASWLAASPTAQPQCFQCAYNAFCTVLPVYNHQTQSSLWGQMPNNGWCEKMMGIFDVLVARLETPRTRKVLESWLEFKGR